MTETSTTSDSVFWELLGIKEFIALDLETTGLNSKTDEIIELGAARFVNGVMTEKYSQLVQPEIQNLPEEIIQLTGITDEDLDDAPQLDDVADDFIKFVGDLPIVGQNIAFDLGFLSADQATLDAFHPSRTVPRTHDTNLIARFLLPAFNSYGLSNLCQHFQIEWTPNHRATDDAIATGMLFALLLKKLASLPLNQLNDAFGFVKGTASPLANTLERVMAARGAGFIPSEVPPMALTGTFEGRSNIFEVFGDNKPANPATSGQIARLFNDKSRFEAVMPGYEMRQEQVGMSMEVAGAMAENRILVVEAGTGVGKSMGYLIPALLSGEQAVISTHTKNLQDQLFYDEIPRLGRLFKFGFTAALLKGRRNYLCTLKWRNWSANPERGGISASLREKAAMATRWVSETQTGDTSELNAIYDKENAFFPLISSEPGFCLGNRCPFARDCHLQKIRQASQKADLIIANHSLVFSDIVNDAGLLGERVSRMVLDEAHHLEDVATDQFGLDFAPQFVKATLDRVATACVRKGELWTRLAAHESLNRLVKPLELSAVNAGETSAEVDKFFEALSITVRDKVPLDSNYSVSLRFHAGDGLHQQIAESGENTATSLAGLAKSLKRIRDRMETEIEDTFPLELMQELRSVTDSIVEIATSIQLLREADDTNRVYWAEVHPDLTRPIHLKSAPLELGEMLHEGLWTKVDSAILTSATLSTGEAKDAFGLLVRSLGLDLVEPERLRTIVYGSPFNYMKNCGMFYPRHIPAPTEDAQGHLQMVADICGDLARETRRGILVLFTSYHAMRSVKRMLDENLSDTDIEVMIQRGARDRHRLINTFKNAKNGAVLMGTDSFWEGIDLPGSALEIVLIPRLPFGVPNDPIISARIDRMRSAGRNPFNEYQLPAAILRMRQGTGRLIRTQSDRGVVMVLDSRVVNKRYGRDFRQVLPGRVYSPSTNNELVGLVKDFFKSDKGK